MATHNRAGEITYTHAPTDENEYRYEVLITTYTKQSSTQADRDSLTINWGDNSSTVLARNNGPIVNGVPNGEFIGNDIKVNTYSGFHSYPGPGTYLLWMQDLNRIDEIININFGNSIDVPFYIENTLKILDPQFYSFNSSPQLLQPPIDFGNVGAVFIHNPNAFDPDGDSLHYELIVPKLSTLSEVPNYFYPDQVSPGPENNMSLNPLTGEFIWDAPQEPGNYNIAILITEYRNGVCIGDLRRDMQIIVEETNNNPPEIVDLRDTCIIAGSALLDTMIVATDPDPGNLVSLSAIGSPFEVDNSPATFNITEDSIGYVQALFNWQTNCSHILNQPYTVVFKAEDSQPGLPGHVTLADLETWQITVVPPAPENLVLSLININEVLLEWDSDYSCIDFEKFRGFSVWRRQGCDTTAINPCDIDNALSGYTLLTENITDFQYIDDSVLPGVSYSYRVVANFADISTGGFLLNEIKSVPSNGVCVLLPSDVPVITHVSVQQTDENNGQIYVAWTKPNPEALDTTFNLPPYVYKIYRSTSIGSSNFQVAFESAPANTFAEANDTTFIDGLLNTVDESYTYQIAFYSNNDSIGVSQPASSIYTSVIPAANSISLNWDFQVPWQNYTYNIYRSPDPFGTFDSIAFSLVPEYLDQDLINGQQYCYYIEAKGTYQTPNFPDPLVNLSQIICEVPIDTVPPCAPELMVTNDCNLELNDWTTDNYRNDLNWTSSFNVCGDIDVLAYHIYYTPKSNIAAAIVDTVLGPGNTNYQHFLDNNIAGCYYVTAIDSFANESVSSNVICVENCYKYELPNAFTPNEDGSNDLLVPVDIRFVDRIDLQIFSRWGTKVFETNNPEINWDGTNLNGKALNDGVYFYTCDVFQITFNGEESIVDQLSGYIHLVNGN